MEGRPGDRDAWIDERHRPHGAAHSHMAGLCGLRPARGGVEHITYISRIEVRHALAPDHLHQFAGPPDCGPALHYTLPQREGSCAFVNAESRLTEVGGFNGLFFAQRDSGSAQSSDMRDLRLISTIRPDGRPLVFRNEDTGVLWPPYFKFDSEDLQTEAANPHSTENDPQWVAITHYGWRSNLILDLSQRDLDPSG